MAERRASARYRLFLYCLAALILFYPFLLLAAPCPSFSKDSPEREALFKQAWALKEEGDALSNQLRYEKALEKYGKGLELAEKADYYMLVWDFYMAIGKIYSRTGENVKALDYFLRALKISERAPIKYYKGMTLWYSGLTCCILGRYREAWTYLEESEKILIAAKDKRSTALVDMDIALYYTSVYNFDKAHEYCRKSLKIADELGDSGLRGYALNMEGVVYYNQCDFSSALACYKKSLEIMISRGDNYGLGALAYNLGKIYYSQSEYKKAREYFDKALAISRDVQNRYSVSTISNSIGCVYYAIGDFKKALEYFNESLSMSTQIGDKGGQCIALCNIATVFREMKKYREAMDCLKKSSLIAREPRDDRNLKMVYRNMGVLAYEIKSWDIALLYLTLACKMNLELNDSISQGYTLYYTGKVNFEIGDYENAILNQEAALKCQEMTFDALGKYKSLMELGRIYEKLNQEDRAIEYLEKSIRELESVKQGLQLEEYKTLFMKDKMKVYEMLIRLLMRKKRFGDAWSYAERAKARIFLDMMGNSRIRYKSSAPPELCKEEESLEREIMSVRNRIQKESDQKEMKQHYIKLGGLLTSYEQVLEKLKLSSPEYASIKSVQVSSLKEIQKRLDGDSVVLEYCTDEDKTWLFLIDRESLEVVEIAAGEKELKKKITALRKSVMLKEDCTERLKELSAFLLPPVAQKKLQDKNMLIVVPHSVLHYLPFSMLVDSDGAWLVKRCEIITEPSASVWKFCLDKKGSQSSELAAYALGGVEANFDAMRSDTETDLDILSPETTRGMMAPLPATEDEVNDIAALYPGGTVLIGDTMTSLQVKNTIKKKRRIHFATHGILDPGHPLFSGLLLYDGLLTVKDVFSLEFDADLVVLSACNTGVGELSGGDEIVGMSRAFMYAGAPTVVASLWSVSDESTAMLMKSFYGHMKEGESAGSALRHAQVELMEKYPHPFYWAPFILMGSPGK